MPSERDPSVVYRRFLASDVYQQEDGKRRLRSSLFNTAELSVDDGALATPDETAARSSVPCGVAAIPKTLIAELGLSLDPDPPDDPANRAAHRTIRDAKDSAVRKMAKAAVVVIQLPGSPIPA